MTTFIGYAGVILVFFCLCDRGFGMAWLGRHTSKWLMLPSVGLVDAGAVVLATFVATQLVRILEADPARLMFLIPALSMVINDLRRIGAAEGDVSRNRRMALEHPEDIGAHDRRDDVAVAYAHFTGDLTGWAIVIGAALMPVPWV